MSGISLILDVAEIVLFARKRLGPVFHLVSACIKTAFWLFYFIVAVIGTIRGGWLVMIIAIILW
jgi:hypothetical protein